MNVMIGQMSLDTDPEMGNAVQLSNIIKMLLDPDNMLTAINKSEKIDFLNYFYKHCIVGLIGELYNQFLFLCWNSLLSIVLCGYYDPLFSGGGWNGVHVHSELPGTLVHSFIYKSLVHASTMERASISEQT